MRGRARCFSYCKKKKKVYIKKQKKKNKRSERRAILIRIQEQQYYDDVSNLRRIRCGLTVGGLVVRSFSTRNTTNNLSTRSSTDTWTILCRRKNVNHRRPSRCGASEIIIERVAARGMGRGPEMAKNTKLLYSVTRQSRKTYRRIRNNKTTRRYTGPWSIAFYRVFGVFFVYFFFLGYLVLEIHHSSPRDSGDVFISPS